MKFKIFNYILIIFLTLCVENSRNQDDCVYQTKEIVDCSNIYVNKTKLLLYTRTNPTNPIEINETNVNQIEKKEKNVVIIHGYESDPSLLVYPDMRKKYLQRYDSNVIMVDWSKIAWECYPIGICKFPKLSEFLAKLLCEIQKQSNVSLTNFHLVGHSMGAHLSGLIGQNTIKICDQHIGRITGMDPAGPVFQLFPPIKRLDKSDALFVDVIHTNVLLAGYINACGHVDFYVNCGINQAGCPPIDLKNISSSFLAKSSCSHIRSLIYMTESISSNNFIAQSCSSCPYVCRSDRNPEYIIMGEDCPTNSTRRVFWIPTNPTSPYGAGCSLYENGCWCSHLKSVSYFRESMDSHQFIAQSCSHCPLLSRRDQKPEYIIMGEDWRSDRQYIPRFELLPIVDWKEDTFLCILKKIPMRILMQAVTRYCAIRRVDTTCI